MGNVPELHTSGLLPRPIGGRVRKAGDPSTCIFKSFQMLTVCTQVDSEAGVSQMAPGELLLEGLWAEVEQGSKSTVVVLNPSPAPPPHW